MTREGAMVTSWKTLGNEPCVNDWAKPARAACTLPTNTNERRTTQQDTSVPRNGGMGATWKTNAVHQRERGCSWWTPLPALLRKKGKGMEVATTTPT